MVQLRSNIGLYNRMLNVWDLVASVPIAAWLSHIQGRCGRLRISNLFTVPQLTRRHLCALPPADSHMYDLIYIRISGRKYGTKSIHP